MLGALVKAERMGGTDSKMQLWGGQLRQRLRSINNRGAQKKMMIALASTNAPSSIGPSTKGGDGVMHVS